MNIAQPMTSLLPKKRKVLDLNKLSVINDDGDGESVASASRRGSGTTLKEK